MEMILKSWAAVVVISWLVASPAIRELPVHPELVDIAEFSPNIVVDLKYATADNFLKEPVYDTARCLVHKDLAVRLDRAQKILEKDGLGLKIYDGFRPVEVQKRMWKLVPDERYVANPFKGGSMHNRGVAADLTLVDRQGIELEMPTAFDTFSPRSHQWHQEASVQQRANRALLRTVLREVGLVPLETEWWHYQLPNARKYPVLK